jgi:hypothetical protein
MTTPAELRAQIDVKGAEISLLTEEIEARLNEAKDWRLGIERAPIRTVAVAVGAGLLVSGVGIPLVRIIARQAGVAVKASLTAYVTAMLTSRLRQLAER